MFFLLTTEDHAKHSSFSVSVNKNAKNINEIINKIK